MNTATFDFPTPSKKTYSRDEKLVIVIPKTQFEQLVELLGPYGDVVDILINPIPPLLRHHWVNKIDILFSTPAPPQKDIEKVRKITQSIIENSIVSSHFDQCMHH